MLPQTTECWTSKETAENRIAVRPVIATWVTTIVSLMALISIFSGCASQGLKVANPDAEVPPIVESFRMSSEGPEPFTISSVTIKHDQFDIPMENNEHVARWVDYFTGKGRIHFDTYLERAQYFVPYIVPILKEEGVPRDLVYLAMIESGFNIRARSRAKAVGAWQFISWTGKRYGLRVDWWVDERRDIAKSTRAAVRYLKDLYSHFGTWELAAAAYNAGEFKVARAIRRYGTYDFWTLSRQKFLKPETRNYVPKMMAAAIVAKNRTLFGFPSGSVELQLAGDTFEEKPTPVAPPATTGEMLGRYAEDFPGRKLPAVLVEHADDHRETPHLTKDGEVGGEKVAGFEVQCPADIMQIAKAAGVTYEKVKKLNPDLIRWMTPPDVSTYVIRLPASTTERFLTNYNHPAFPREIDFKKIAAHPGDTIRKIARRTGLPVTGIAGINRMDENAAISAGRMILLPVPNDATRSLASLDLRDPPRRSYSRSQQRRQKRTLRVSSSQF